MKIIIVILFIVVSVGCAQRKPFTILDAKTQCATYGFKQDTPESANCVMTAMEQEKVAIQRRNQIMGQAFKDAGKGFQKGYQRRSRRSVHCSSNTVGGYTSTNCY